MNLRELGQRLTEEANSQKLSAFLTLLSDYGVDFDKLSNKQAENLLKAIQEL